MRFRAGIHHIHTFAGLTASLSSLGNIAWLRLSDEDVRFTIIPEKGTQVWAVLQIDTIFDDTFSIESAADKNTINLEVPLPLLQRALKSAQNANATNATIRLTKKDNVPLLALTITTTTPSGTAATPADKSAYGASGTYGGPDEYREEDLAGFSSDRETIIVQDIPIRVLSPASVQGLHEPVCREPDVHIMFPPLVQLKAISDRFTKLAITSAAKNSASAKLVLEANMHGCLRLSLVIDAMRISSLWTGLVNPELDPSTVQGGQSGIEAHPSTRMKAFGDTQGTSDQGWATVRVDGKDWGRVLGISRLGGRVIACFCDENALILYVYLANDHDDTESVITYYVSSYSA